MRTLPPQTLLRELFAYNKVTGAWRWRITDGWRNAGDMAGTVDDKGRLSVWVPGHGAYFVSRLIWKWVTGTDPIGQVDHIDVNPSNNRWRNLRDSTGSQNRANIRRPRTNTSGFKGVHYFKARSHLPKPWGATIKINRRSQHIGYFSTPEEASRAYNQAARDYFGPFARTNTMEARNGRGKDTFSLGK